MAKYSYTFMLILIIVFSSCQSLEPLSIDYMLPAEVSFPAELRRVAIVNNTSNTPESTLKLQKAKVNFDELSRGIAYTNGIPAITTESLAREIANQNYFNEVVICDSALRANDIFNRESTLSQNEVTSLIRNLDVDFIIALENLQMQATRATRYLPEWTAYQATLDVKVLPTVKVYLPHRKGPMVTINAIDSIFWEGLGNSESHAVYHLESDSTMIREASEFAGVIPVKYLLPYWKTADRVYFTNGSTYMRDATVFVRQDAWDKAFELWKQAFDSAKSDKKKMYAAFNIALYYEMKDNLTEAETWATKAQTYASAVDKIDQRQTGSVTPNQVPYYYMTSVYVNELKERVGHISKLRSQMNRFNDDF